MSDIFILIPSRIGSTRLENKPLQNIEGKSLVHRVFENALSITNAPVIDVSSGVEKKKGIKCEKKIKNLIKYLKNEN